MAASAPRRHRAGARGQDRASDSDVNSAEWVYAGYGLLVLVLALWVRSDGMRGRRSGLAAQLAALLYIGGLLLLPPLDYRHAMPNGVTYTPWIMGVLIPTPHQWINKAWMAPLAAVLIAALCQPARLRAFRPCWYDWTLLAFCLWPLGQGVLGIADHSPGILAMIAQLLGSWGLPWLVARLWWNDRAGRLALIDALIVLTCITLPISAFEGVSPVRVHELLYGVHPYATDGTPRYIGYRPIGFFEHGNQYGIWICLAAVAAWWRARTAARGDARAIRWIVAIVLIGAALAAQSVGAIGMMLLAALWIDIAPAFDRHRAIARTLWLGGGAAGLVCAAILLSPPMIGRTFSLAVEIAGTLTDVGRGSLPWRAARALDIVPQLMDSIVLGRGRYDWYMPVFRPWDLLLMMLGVVGITGMTLFFASAAGALTRRRWMPPARRDSTRMLLTALVLGAFGDALLNTFVFLPALAMLGAVAPSAGEGRVRRRRRPMPAVAADGLPVPAFVTRRQPGAAMP